MTNLSVFPRAGGVAVAALAVLAFSGGCGSGDTSHGGGDASPASPSVGSSVQVGADHNDADVTFAQSMIPHHQQAVEMAALAETRAGDPEVKALAAEIKQAQQPEIQQMSSWLGRWGVLPTMSSMPSGGHSGHGDMTGMMTAEEMSAMGSASGAQFDRMFLQMMIRHHEGAVQMAGTEQQQGENAAAKDLAGQIERAQNDEIAQMQALLAKK